MQLKLELPIEETILRRGRTFQCEKSALIEDFGDIAFIYGHWDRYFGCWVNDRKTRAVQECVPDWVFLNETGQGGSPTRERSLKFPVQPRARLQTAADVAFFAYFQNVPHHIRSLVWSLSEHQWAALDCIYQDPASAEFIDLLLAQGQSNYLHACFALAHEESSRWERRKRAERIRSRPRCELLDDLTRKAGIDHYGSWTERRLRLLYKVDDPIISIEDITGFMRVTTEELVQDYASHTPTLSLAGLEVLQSLHHLGGNTGRLSNVLEILCRSHETEVIRALFEHARREAVPLSGQRISGLLRSIRRAEDVALLKFELEDQLGFSSLLTGPLPTPPFAGDDLIVPLASGKDLDSEGRNMRNCVAGDIADVAEGLIYYYHWRHVEAATVQVRRTTEGWVFGDALGYRNRSLPDELRQGIIEHVQQRLAATGSAMGMSRCNV